jgi:hypothetical protein
MVRQIGLQCEDTPAITNGSTQVYKRLSSDLQGGGGDQSLRNENDQFGIYRFNGFFKLFGRDIRAKVNHVESAAAQKQG